MRTVLFVQEKNVPASIATPIFERFWGELMRRYRLPDFRVERCPPANSPGIGMPARRNPLPEGTATNAVSNGRIAFIHACIQTCADEQAVAESVFLVGYKAAAAACLDLLVRTHLPNVKHLVTIGLPVPLAYGRLPNHLPPWANFYDPRDDRCFRGRDLYGERITDIAVDTGSGVPEAPLGWWDNKRVYDEIITIVDHLA